MRKTGFVRTIGKAGALVLAGMLLVACEKKPPPPPPPPPPKPVVKTPEPVDINGVLSSVKHDSRVQFPQASAPADRTLAEATIRLASALAKGDSKEFGSLLDPGAKAILEDLVSSGSWADATKKIEQVRVISVSSRTEEKATQSDVTLAVQVPGQAFLLAWAGTRSGDAWTFKNAWADGAMKSRASEFDGSAPSESGSASAATPAPSADDEKKVNIYIMYQLAGELSASKGGPAPTRAQLDAAMKAYVPGLTSAEIDDAMKRGKELVESGDAAKRLTPDNVVNFVDGPFAGALGSVGFPTPEDRIALFAKVFKSTPEAIKQLYEQGKNGSQPSGPRASKGSTPKPKAPDPDTIKKSTPVGPVTIPKGRPSGGDNN
jgi:hypothetical protein